MREFCRDYASTSRIRDGLWSHALGFLRVKDEACCLRTDLSFSSFTTRRMNIHRGLRRQATPIALVQISYERPQSPTVGNVAASKCQGPTILVNTSSDD